MLQAHRLCDDFGPGGNRKGPWRMEDGTHPPNQEFRGLDQNRQRAPHAPIKLWALGSPPGHTSRLVLVRPFYLKRERGARYGHEFISLLPARVGL